MLRVIKVKQLHYQLPGIVLELPAVLFQEIKIPYIYQEKMLSSILETVILKVQPILFLAELQLYSKIASFTALKVRM